MNKKNLKTCSKKNREKRQSFFSLYNSTSKTICHFSFFLFLLPELAIQNNRSSIHRTGYSLTIGHFLQFGKEIFSPLSYFQCGGIISFIFCFLFRYPIFFWSLEMIFSFFINWNQYLSFGEFIWNEEDLIKQGCW